MKIKSSILALSVPVIALSFSAFTAKSADTTPTFERGFADLVKKVGPGVVNISTFARPKIQSNGPLMYNDETFQRFFEEFFGGRMGPPSGRNGRGGPNHLGPNGGPEDGQEDDDGRLGPGSRRRGKAVPLALGTGFIIDANEGLILTNYHVIQGSEEVKIQFNEDEDELAPADIIGRDPELDVALLKVKVKRKLTAIPLGDSDKMDVGEYVIAIGNPLGYGHTVSHGILSAKGRRNPEFRLGKYLQTDASINPGNSGGPMVSTKGEVIGINNAIDARAQGIGFAIPINLVKAALTQLKTKGSVSRGYLGVGAADLTPEIAEQLKMKTTLRGVLVTDVGRGAPADKAGIKPYDVITSINGEKITNSQDLTAKITSLPLNSTADVRYVRAGKEKSVAVIITERPANGLISTRQGPPRPEPKESRSAEFDEYGFSVDEVSEQQGSYFGIPLSAFKGKPLLVVTDIEEGKPAANSGLNRGDVILDIGGKDSAGKEAHTIEDVRKALKSAPRSALVRVKRFNQQGGDFVSVVVLTK